MSKNSKKIRVRILNPVSGCYTSLAHARRFVRRGVAEWAEDRAIRFVVPARRSVAHGPSMGVVPFASVCDSGFSGFLTYPQPSRGLGAKFPGLARVGAGLA